MIRRTLALAALASLATGCVTHRLEGPIHAADGPPWVAPEWPAPVTELEEVEHRVLLIGDAGLFLAEDPTLAALRRWAGEHESSAVVYLGDNIYNDGLLDDDRERGEKILSQQLAAAGRARKVVVPGNHDWGMNPAHQNGRAIQNQQDFVDGWSGGNAVFLPRDGCMGPDRDRLPPSGASGRGVSVVAVDPTPWINEQLRSVCPRGESAESHLASLRSTLQAARGDWVVVVSHYPLETGGPHGGLTYGWVGDRIVGLLGWWYGGLGNTYEPGYADWIAAARDVMRETRPAVYAAGHDHSLQVLRGEAVGTQVVSGAGAPGRVSTVTHVDRTLFAHAHAGFVVLDFGHRAGRPAAVLRVVENGHEAPVFEMELPSAS